MKILIVEDEKTAALGLKKQLEVLKPEAVVLAQLDTIEDTVNWLQNNPMPDLIFMDVQLGDGSSFEILNKTDVEAPVIFITASDEYALKAFKVNSIDYLIKPVGRKELKNALDKFETLRSNHAKSSNSLIELDGLLQSLNLPKTSPQYKGRFLIKLGDKFFSVSKDQIAYFYTEVKSVFVLTHDKQRLPIDQSLDDLEKVLDPEFFFRINRQFIVHIDAVTRLHNYFHGKMKVYLKPEFNEDVLVSREKATLLKQWLDR